MPFQIWTTASRLLFLIYSTSVPPHSAFKFWSLGRAPSDTSSRIGILPSGGCSWVWVWVSCTPGMACMWFTLARKHHMPWPIAVRIIFLFRCSGPLLVTPEPDTGLANGLGHLCHRFWFPRAYEAAHSYQASADRVYHEGLLIGASSCRKESPDVLCIFGDFEVHVFSKPMSMYPDAVCISHKMNLIRSETMTRPSFDAE